MSSMRVVQIRLLREVMAGCRKTIDRRIEDSNVRQDSTVSRAMKEKSYKIGK
jgi:hypothetical protein